jgi:hypothetical protein
LNARKSNGLRAVNQVRREIEGFALDRILTTFALRADGDLAAVRVDRQIHRMREGRRFLYVAFSDEMEVTALREDCGSVVDRAVLASEGQLLRG